MFTLSACNLSTKGDTKRSNPATKSNCDTNCKSEAKSYVKKLAKESGSWDPSSFDLWGWGGADKVGNK